MQNFIYQLRTKRLKKAKKKLEADHFVMTRFERGFPEKPEFIPFLLSEVALDEKLATDVWNSLEPLARRIQIEEYLKKEEVELGIQKGGKEDRHTIIIVVHGGKNLAPKDPSGRSDPYVIVKYGKEYEKTPVMWQTLNPKWENNEKGEFYKNFKFDSKYKNKYQYVFPFPYFERSEILIQCWDKDAFNDDFMGQFWVPEPLTTLKEVPFFLEEDPEKKKYDKKKSNTKKSDTKKSDMKKSDTKKIQEKII